MDDITAGYLDSLLQFSQQRIAMFNEELKFVMVDPAFESMLGYSAGELTGCPIRIMIHPSDWRRVSDRIHRRFRGEEYMSHYVFLGQRKDGTMIKISTISTITTLNDQRLTLAICEDISTQMQFAAQRALSEERLQQTCLAAIRALSHMSNLRDPYTGNHEARVGALATAIGQEMKLSEAVCDTLKLCGSVHDIGKISVPTDILSKPGRLTPPEFEIVKAHAEHGFQILSKIDIPQPAALVAHQHHERLDGSGYPLGLKGDDIILESRIMAVADVVEAMSSHRPYRAGLGVDMALKEIYDKAERCFSPDIVEACVRLFRVRKFTFSPA